MRINESILSRIVRFRMPDCCRPLWRIVCTWTLWIFFFAIFRLPFVAMYARPEGVEALPKLQRFFKLVSLCATTSWHGLPMDMSMAGYLTVVPALLIITAIWVRRRWVNIALMVYFVVTALAVSLVYTLDGILYDYWHFRLDSTPLFYFLSSPSSAMASVSWQQGLEGAAFWLFLAGVIVLNFVKWLPRHCPAASMTDMRGCPEYAHRRRTTMITALGTAMLFIPIRGGFTVSTMNPSRAYFSTDQTLNHAALNPMFNLMYSLTHQSDFGRRYRFMDDGEAERIYRCGLYRPVTADSLADGQPLIAPGSRPDIVFIVLESFSSHLLPSAGGADVATGLDSIARSGLLLTDVYAASFRTDRALAAIFSGLPGQPPTSVLKYPDKIEALPTWPAELGKAGYEVSYYYGGDTNFTNMQAYLMQMGCERVVRDTDFDLSLRTSKWGVHDHVLFGRVLADLQSRRSSRRLLTIVQTSSSHEPFEVPYTGTRFAKAGEERRRAFAYTDGALTDFVNALSQLPSWSNTLVVLVPDHFGCWPQNLKTVPEQHRIPLVFTGGALQRRGIDGRIANQTDIAATLLAALGLDRREFVFSRDIFDPSTAQTAIVSQPEQIAVITPDTTLTWQCDADRTVDGDSRLVPLAKAHLQLLYRYIDRLKRRQ